MILHRKKIIFIHIPKTAGTTIEQHLRAHSDWPSLYPHDAPWKVPFGYREHDTANDIKKAIGNDLFESYFKFTIVRNPFDRMVSVWKYGLLRDRPTHTGIRPGICFSDWLRESWNRFPSTLDYITDENGKIQVDKVYKFENLQNAWDDICENMQIEKEPLSRFRKTSAKSLRSRAVNGNISQAPVDNYRNYYTIDSEKFLMAKLKDEFDIFGYGSINRSKVTPPNKSKFWDRFGVAHMRSFKVEEKYKLTQIKGAGVWNDENETLPIVRAPTELSHKRDITRKMNQFQTDRFIEGAGDMNIDNYTLDHSKKIDGLSNKWVDEHASEAVISMTTHSQKIKVKK
jgi:hypothetical protein